MSILKLFIYFIFIVNKYMINKMLKMQLFKYTITKRYGMKN